MTEYLRSETAIVRPFGGISEADIPLDDVKLLVNGTPHEPGTIVLPEASLTSANLTLVLPDVEEVCKHVEQTSVPLEDCGLVILAAGKTHRVTWVHREYLRSAAWPTEFQMPRDQAPLVLRDPAGFTLTTAIVLLNELTPRPPRPHLAGTWLARRDFRLSPELDDTAFSPEELTDAIRAFHKLPPGVLRYVQVDDPLVEEGLSDAVRVFVDPAVLNLLLVSPSDAASVQVQTELAVITTETVAQKVAIALANRDRPLTHDELTAFPATERFMVNLADSLSAKVDHVLAWSATQTEYLRARLESAFDMKAVTARALKEK